MNLEYECARTMLGPVAEHFLIAPLIGEDRIRFDLLDDSAYHNILSSGEQAIVDLARGFWNGGPTEMTFGACLRRLDDRGRSALLAAVSTWMKGQL